MNRGCRNVTDNSRRKTASAARLVGTSDLPEPATMAVRQLCVIDV